MADSNSTSDRSSFLPSLLGVLATIAVFALLVLLVNWISGDEPISPVRAFPDAPSGASLKAKDTLTLTTYGWVDQEKGIVRIPVDRAKDLVIQELNQ